MITIISDIDDVIRDFRRNIVDSMNLYFRGEDWGEYYYKNDKIREFFEWYRNKPYFYKIYEHSYENEDLVVLYTRLLFNNNAEIFFLSSNPDDVGRHLTTKFILKTLPTLRMTNNIFYVNRWYEKIDFIMQNKNKLLVDEEKTLFIDDRPDSCLQFEENGIKSFWYTKYMSDKAIQLWIDENNGYAKLSRGNTKELIKFIENSFGGIHV